MNKNNYTFKNYNINIKNKNEFFTFFFLENINRLFNKYINKFYLLNNNNFIIIELNNSKYQNNFFILLKKYFYFDILSDMIGLDFLNQQNIFSNTLKSRFSINYILCNIKYNLYIGITTSANFNNELNSIINI